MMNLHKLMCIWTAAIFLFCVDGANGQELPLIIKGKGSIVAQKSIAESSTASNVKTSSLLAIKNLSRDMDQSFAEEFEIARKMATNCDWSPRKGSVRVLEAPIGEVWDSNINGLTATWGTEDTFGSKRVWGLYTPNLSLNRKTQHMLATSKCAVPVPPDIRIEMSPVIFISRESGISKCIEENVRKHEMGHHFIYKKSVEKIRKYLVEVIGRWPGMERGENAAEVLRRKIEPLEEEINEIVKKELEESKKSNHQFDREEFESQNVRKGCSDWEIEVIRGFDAVGKALR